MDVILGLVLGFRVVKPPERESPKKKSKKWGVNSMIESKCADYVLNSAARVLNGQALVRKNS